MTQTSDRPGAGGQAGPINQVLAGNGTVASPRLPDNRAALCRLLRQIDLDEALRRRAVRDAILTASAWWWRRRAEDFEWARPRPGDFNGLATPAELAAAGERCRDVAQGCRNKATLIEWEAAEND